ncbi:hypothetical protein D3C79_986010 [compost metagenome]
MLGNGPPVRVEKHFAGQQLDTFNQLPGAFIGSAEKHHPRKMRVFIGVVHVMGQHFAQAAAQFGDGASVQVHAEFPLDCHPVQILFSSG